MSGTLRVPSRLEIVCKCGGVCVLGRFVYAGAPAPPPTVTAAAAWCLNHQGPDHELVIELGDVIVDVEA